MLSYHACHRAIHGDLEGVQLFPSNFSTHQIYYLEIELHLDHYRHAHFLRSVCLHLTIFRHRVQEPCTVEQSYKKVPFPTDVSEDLSTLAVVHHISTDGQRCSEILANLLSFELAERRVLTIQELTVFQDRLSVRNLDFYSAHDFLSGWNCHCRNLL